MNRLWNVAAAFVFVMAVGAVPAMAQQVPDDGPAPLSTNCTFNFGSGDLVWCVSESGNLMSFRALGIEHIRLGVLVEGYTLCTTGFGPYYDHANVASGWGAPLTISSSGSAVTIQRITTDGRFKLLQKFTRDTTERDVTVTETLTNQTGAAIGGIQFARVADFDHGSNFEASVRGVWNRGSHAATLTAITAKYPAASAIHNTFQAPTNCTPAPAANPGFGDFSAFVRYDVGSLGAGKSATFKHVYRGQ